MFPRFRAACCLVLLLCAPVQAGQPVPKVIAPSESAEDAWQLKLALPGWFAGISGDIGVQSLVTSIDVGPMDLLRRVDMTASFRAEASRGRFGLMADFLYLSLSDGVGTPTIVRKVDLQFDQTMAELAVRWRVVETPRASLDLYGGVRYTNLFQQAVTQADSERIAAGSTRLVDAVADQLRTSLSEKEIGKLIAQRLASGLRARVVRPEEELPTGPLNGRLVERLQQRLQPIIAARAAALAAALRAEAQAVGAAARAAAQRRISRLKRDLSRQIAAAVEPQVSTRVARTDDWWDPFIGLRGRYQFSDQLYLTAKGDVGGFGLGADFTWQASAALGLQLTKSLFVEAGYRALGLQYDHDGLSMDTITHGAEITAGLVF